MNKYIIPLHHLGINDIAKTGGKNASLGEMIQHLSGLGVKVPGGFATTVEAYHEFLQHNDLGLRINQRLAHLETDNIADLSEAGRDS